MACLSCNMAYISREWIWETSRRFGSLNLLRARAGELMSKHNFDLTRASFVQLYAPENDITGIWYVTLTDKGVHQQALLYLGRIQVGRWSLLCANCVREIDNLKSVQISKRIKPMSFTLTAPKRPRQFHVFQSLLALALKSRRSIIIVRILNKSH